ncbi:MAG TPA: class I SAM-dependent methyltransferase [Solirubrobacteraceae bacterium]|nr:class I SAM-dependent methyltransferase [Solirubrobacteraceae bacterium]
MRYPGREIAAALGDAVPCDHARQTLAETYVQRAAGRVPGRPWRVLDLGCGPGDSVDLFRARDPEVQWVGLDIAGSREVLSRTRTDARFEQFDGVTIPFADDSFDLVYCKQVLEHVHRPAALIAEVARVLAPQGSFAGSTSQMEPFHSQSTFGYTPGGLRSLLNDAGLQLVELRPGIDAITLIARRLAPQGSARVDRLWGRWWGRRSPLNGVLDAYGAARGMDARALNATKLLFCGQLAFEARPMAATPEPQRRP